MLRTLLLLLLLLNFMSMPAALAQSKKQPEVSKEQATTLAQRRFPGKILKVQTEKGYYRVRLIQTDGRVVTVLVDNRTGRVNRDDN